MAYNSICYLGYYGSYKVDQKNNRRSMVDLMGTETVKFNLRLIFKKLCLFEFWIKNSHIFAWRQVGNQQNGKFLLVNHFWDQKVLKYQ